MLSLVAKQNLDHSRVWAPPRRDRFVSAASLMTFDHVSVRNSLPPSRHVRHGAFYTLCSALAPCFACASGFPAPLRWCAHRPVRTVGGTPAVGFRCAHRAVRTKGQVWGEKEMRNAECRVQSAECRKLSALSRQLSAVGSQPSALSRRLLAIGSQPSAPSGGLQLAARNSELKAESWKPSACRSLSRPRLGRVVATCRRLFHGVD